MSETRQVFDFPVLQFEVTEHHAMQAICSCGHVHTAEFPAGVRATVQYGPRAQAAMVHLNQNHAVSVQRTAALMKDLFGLPVSQATVIKAAVVSAAILQPTVDAIGQAAVNADVLHADETGLRVVKKLHWLHVLATDTLTWMGCHPKRGTEAFDALALVASRMPKIMLQSWPDASNNGISNFFFLVESKNPQTGKTSMNGISRLDLVDHFAEALVYPQAIVSQWEVNHLSAKFGANQANWQTEGQWANALSPIEQQRRQLE